MFWSHVLRLMKKHWRNITLQNILQKKLFQKSYVVASTAFLHLRRVSYVHGDCHNMISVHLFSACRITLVINFSRMFPRQFFLNALIGFVVWILCIYAHSLSKRYELEFLEMTRWVVPYARDSKLNLVGFFLGSYCLHGCGHLLREVCFVCVAWFINSWW